MVEAVDYDLHGILGIRLLGATERDVAMVTRQIGPIGASLSREPDMVIRFVDRLPTTAPLRYLGVDDAGFTEDAFLVLRGKHKSQARVQIPFDQVGQRCEIICERGLTAVPLLMAIINLTMLGKGYLPLHASAFLYRGLGALATGWAKGGKTETLLAFMSQGAAYVGDEWVYLDREGQQMFGIPEPIRVWQWHLDYLPQYQALLDRGTRARLKALEWLTGILDQPLLKGQGWRPFKMIRRARPLLQKQQYTHLSPLEAFGQACCPLAGPLDRLFFVVSHESAEVTVQPIEPEEISQRMVFSLQEEQQELNGYYRKFCFAFPTCRNELLECSAERQRHLLQQALAGKETYVVYHPYPAPIPRLFEVMGPLFEEGRR
ncbi:MAG: hypothetical protein L0332_31530 [Chloroflexi bacterium]|nr:hypothetical protein [Chloroflexota bacterium]MCI0575257.1 hypothetical protein [Chloroflexota bacterium]MCI0645703.1 hypothetical protein [Chloroflexota bacterium]MCI0731234.1 hypothetical protein [Chloroflexota bacterium]